MSPGHHASDQRFPTASSRRSGAEPAQQVLCAAGPLQESTAPLGADARGRPAGLAIRDDIEHRPDRPKPYRARLRWNDPLSQQVRTKLQSFATVDEAQAWIDRMLRLVRNGVDPVAATLTPAEYGDSVMPLAVRGLESNTLDPYPAGWHERVVPSLGRVIISMITNGCSPSGSGCRPDQ
jgi:hypothetical protein